MNKKILISCTLLLTSCVQQQRDDEQKLAANFYEQASMEAHTNPKKALNLINKSLEHRSTPKALLFKATLLYSIKEYQESVALFKKIINDKKTPPAMRADATNNYACTLYDMGNEDEAIATWGLLTSDRDYLSPELAFYNIGLIYVKRAFALGNQKTPQLITTLNLAETALLNALKISKYFVDAMFYLAQVFIMQDRKHDAQKVLQQVLIEAPEHEAAQRILNELERQAQSQEVGLRNQVS